jgi:hypothetical protein
MKIHLVLGMVGLCMGIGMLMLGIIGLLGCDYNPTPSETPQTANLSWSKVTYSGHTYVCHTVEMGKVIVHDPDCPCHKKLERE